MKHLSVRNLLLFLATTFFIGCSYAPFQVKSRVNLPADAFPYSATQDTLRVSAQALRDEDECSRRFDGNLLLFEILPVQVQIENQGPAALTNKRLRFRLEDGAGRQYALVPVKKVLDRQMKFYGYRAYSAQGYKEVQATYAGHAFPEKLLIEPGSFQQGVVFFEIRGGIHQVSNAFILEVQGLGPSKKPLRIALQ